ncbi:unnamed protein product [Allacma fusca]|uniref:Uncharacterized protein n=1 Tax=Allacma fusca TaxID=39272 RepID=A0A8J2JPF8_9HEXA|nr:unnamed protein product [Allacma fusca]
MANCSQHSSSPSSLSRIIPGAQLLCIAGSWQGNLAPLTRISAPLFGGAWHCATPMPSPSNEHCSDSFSVSLNPHVPKLTGNWSVGGPPSDSDFTCLDPIPYQNPRLSDGDWKTFNDVHGKDIATRQTSNSECFNVITPKEYVILECILAERPPDMSNLDEDVAEPADVNSVAEPQVAGPSRPKPPPIKINIWTQEQWAVIEESFSLCARVREVTYALTCTLSVAVQERWVRGCPDLILCDDSQTGVLGNQPAWRCSAASNTFCERAVRSLRFIAISGLVGSSVTRLSAPLFGGSWHCATPMPSPNHDNCSDSFSVDLDPHVPKMTGNSSFSGPPSDSDFSCIDPIPYQHPRLSAGNWKTYFRGYCSKGKFQTESQNMELHPNLFAYDTGDSTESSSSSEDVEPEVAGPSRLKPPPIKFNIWDREQLAIFHEDNTDLTSCLGLRADKGVWSGPKVPGQSGGAQPWSHF